MKVTVVVPAYNEEAAISASLHALMIQKMQHEYAVIVVDNASTDGTSAVASSYQKKFTVVCNL